MRRLASACLTGLLLVAAPVAAGAQQEAPTPVVTVDQERLFAASLWGKRVQAELEAASQALQAENRRIEAELTAEEKDLTEKRKTLPVEEFRKLADAFDARVTAIRTEQDGKIRDLNLRQDEEKRQFLEAALPIMGKVMQDRGAFAILDARAVVLSVRSIDATDIMLAAIDQRLGAGAAATAP